MTEIKVGDTVRIMETTPRGTTAANHVGKHFVVTEVRSTSTRSNAAPDYVMGKEDFTRMGVYLKDVQKVGINRWRYNDHIVVYPGSLDRTNGYNDRLGEGVTILDETPLPKIYTRWKNQDDGLERLDDEITKAARAYWEAHETNPVLEEAKERGDYARFAYNLRYNDTGKYAQDDIEAALPVIDRLALKESE